MPVIQMQAAARWADLNRIVHVLADRFGMYGRVWGANVKIVSCAQGPVPGPK
jgi:hypothetical protein